MTLRLQYDPLYSARVRAVCAPSLYWDDRGLVLAFDAKAWEATVITVRPPGASRHTTYTFEAPA